MAILVVLFILMTIISTVIILSAAVVASRSDREQEALRTREELEWSKLQLSSSPSKDITSSHHGDNDNSSGSDPKQINLQLT